MEENVKTKTITRVKDRRQPHNQEGGPKRSSKHQGLIKSDLSQLSPPHKASAPFEGGSPIKKLFSEASKIVTIGMEKECALLERENTLQVLKSTFKRVFSQPKNSNETIDNLRKNMFHLQMEYEKLDQNFQKEISCRTEIVKRMDATRELVESVVQCSNVLATSIKQLEEDKLKIAEFYELICQNQKEVEGKQAGTEKFLKDQDELVNSKLAEIKAFQKKIVSQHTETISQLNRKLTASDAQIKLMTQENEDLQRKFQECQHSSNRLQSCLEQQEKLNSLLQETIEQFKRNLKVLKIQRFKYQKLLKNKKKQVFAVVNRNKQLKRSLDKVDVLYADCLSTNKMLKSKNDECRTEFKKHLNEDLAEREAWEAQRKDLLNQLTSKEAEVGDLRAENKNLNEKISNVASSEGAKQLEIEQIQNELSKMLSMNLNLQENVAKLSEDNNQKEKTISELEKRSIAASADLNSQVEFYRNEGRRLEETVKKLESQLSSLQERLARERAENEKIISDFNMKFEENLKKSCEKISNLEKLLEDKTTYTEKLETEKRQFALSEKMTLENLEKEIQMEKLKNRELSKTIQSEKEAREDTSKRLEETKNQILDYIEKVEELKSLNNSLQRTYIEMENASKDLRKELEQGKKSFCDLEEEHRKTERELCKLQKVTEENAGLKLSIADLKNLLDSTEVRLEAYKVAVKKLESEKVQAKSHHSEEVSRLKTELNRLEDALKKENRPPGTPQINSQNKRERETSNTRPRNNSTVSPQKLKTKDTEQEDMGFTEKWHEISTPQSGKKYTSTPRKMLTSTPVYRNLTPLPKNRDPYEFDSDCSAEKIEPNKVVKVLNRQKKEANKRMRINK